MMSDGCSRKLQKLNSIALWPSFYLRLVIVVYILVNGSLFCIQVTTSKKSKCLPAIPLRSPCQNVNNDYIQGRSFNHNLLLYFPIACFFCINPSSHKQPCSSSYFKLKNANNDKNNQGKIYLANFWSHLINVNHRAEKL